MRNEFSKCWDAVLAKRTGVKPVAKANGKATIEDWYASLTHFQRANVDAYALETANETDGSLDDGYGVARTKLGKFWGNP